MALINAERERVGVPSVELGDNIAAQLHAESSLRNCSASHWGTDGLTPAMRYSLAGGYQATFEMFWGVSYCIKYGEGYDELGDGTEGLRLAYMRLLDRYVNSRVIHYPEYKKVNIGVARDNYNLFVYQQFEGDSVEFDSLPMIEDSILSFSGRTRNGVQFTEENNPVIYLDYDPPPHELTAGQLARTGCYFFGRPVGMVVWPKPEGAEWLDEDLVPQFGCPNPYDVPSDTPRPSSFDEAFDLSEEENPTSDNWEIDTLHFQVPLVIASEWTIRGDTFSISADIKDILAKYGNGVYTVTIPAVARYTIFHGITPPDTYTPR